MSTETLTLAPFDADWGQIFSEDRSPPSLNGSIQVAGRTGNHWGAVLSYMNLTGEDREIMWGHLLQLKGGINRLKVNMSTLAYVRSGTGGGSPQLVGGHLAGASSLSIDGAATSVTNWLKRSNWITIGNQLTAATQSVNTNGSGVATISIWPELHKNYADNTPIDISTPFGVFLLRSPGALNMSRYRSGIRDASFALSLEQDVLA